MQERAATAPDPSSALHIIQALKANDEQAMKKLYQLNYKKVERFVLQNSGNISAAKDIYQEAFIAMWRNVKLDKFQAQQADAINGYLFRIAKNKWLDHLKSAHNRRMVSVDQYDNEQAEDEPEDDGLNQRLDHMHTAFEQLGNECKVLLKYFYYAKKSMKEIADLLSLDPASARNKKYRCMQRLRQIALAQNTKSE
ncbi:MAG: sigma-70 family RNA polymerase sigma factor [Bacteroidota bacterium]